MDSNRSFNGAEAERNALFPLPLSDFEFYMFTDDRPSHPMVIVVDAHLSGDLLQDPFQQSVEELLQNHPLLDCRVSEIPGRGLCWVPIRSSQSGSSVTAVSESASTLISWSVSVTASVFAEPPGVRVFDLRTSRGIAIEVIKSPQKSRVVLYLHHACCDGIAALQIVGDLFARYGRKTADGHQKCPEIAAVDANVLRLRETCESPDPATPRHRRSLRRMLGKISRLLLRSSVPLATSRELGVLKPKSSELSGHRTVPSNTAAILSATMSRSEFRVLRAAAAQFHASVNDLLVREMLLHVRDWNRRGRIRFGRRWIRLAVPLNMRTSLHNQMPAANVVSYSLITRREADCDDPVSLLKSIHQQTGTVLQNREGIVALKLLRVLRRIPGAMRLFFRRKTRFCTMVLANVGDVRRRFGGRFPLDKGRWIAGNVILEQIHGVAPVRPGTHAAMSIGDYAGELSLSLRTDGSVLNPDDSSEFLREYVTRLRKIASLSDSEEKRPDGTTQLSGADSAFSDRERDDDARSA